MWGLGALVGCDQRVGHRAIDASRLVTLFFHLSLLQPRVLSGEPGHEPLALIQPSYAPFCPMLLHRKRSRAVQRRALVLAHPRPQRVVPTGAKGMGFDVQPV